MWHTGNILRLPLHELFTTANHKKLGRYNRFEMKRCGFNTFRFTVLQDIMQSLSIRRLLSQQHMTESKLTETQWHLFQSSTTMASNPRRSGNTDLVPPKLRRQARVIFYPLECDKCRKRGPEVSQCNFTANCRILCRTCIASPGPCARCAKDAHCRLTSLADGLWWR